MRFNLVAGHGALAVALTLTACSGGSSGSPTAPTSNASAISITGSGGPSGPSDGSDDGVVSDYASLVNALRAAGAAVSPAGVVSQPFFAPQGQLLSVDGEDVQVFEFASAEEADTVSQSISADGSSIGTSMVGWVAPPHFYKAGKLIVIYVGSDSGVISALQEAMGAQFAGR